MSEDDRKQEKMEILYEIAELDAEMTSISNQLIRAAELFKQLSDVLPDYARPATNTTPGEPRVRSYVQSDELKTSIGR